MGSRTASGVCFINTSTIWGGGESWQYETILGIRDNFGIALIANPQGKLYSLVGKEGIPVTPFKTGNLSFLNPLKLFRAYRTLVRVNPRAVLFNTSKDYKLFALPAKWAGVKNILYRRDNGKPLRAHLLNKLLLRRAVTRILPCSKFIGSAALAKSPNLFPPQKIDVIYNSINIEKWDSNPAAPIDIGRKPDEVIFGCIGRLSAEKGQLFLPQIASRLKGVAPNFRILVAGSGPLRDELNALIAELEVDRWVKPLGFVESNRAFLGAIDCLIIPSYWEGLSTVAIEAMALHRPIVAFNVASNPEVVHNRVNGFLATPFSTDEMADHMRYFINNPHELRSMGDKGRLLAEGMFSRRVTNVQLVKYFE